MITPFGEIPNSLASRMSLQEQHDWLARQVPRRSVIKGIAAASGSLVLPTLWRQSGKAAAGTRVLGRHLAYGADPRTSVILDFSVLGDFTAAQVEATASSGGGSAAQVSVNGVRGSTRRYGRAHLTGLKPGTAYTYQVILDGRPAVQGEFQTAPSQADSFRFTAFGDQGTDAVAGVMLARLAKLRPMFHLLAGDLCYADSSGLGGPGDHFNSAVWDRWLDQNDSVAAGMPWMSVPGNHEMEPGFGMHGYAGFLTRVSPGGASPLAVPVATTFRVGAVGFVGLDSNDVSYEIPANRGWTQNAQTVWLDQVLSGFRRPASGIDFIVAFLHHSPYSTSNTHASEGGIREAWVPLFDRYSVDLVIAGHNHCYERTLPLREGRVVSQDRREAKGQDGTTYITAGGGGAGVGDLPHPFIPFPHKTRVATNLGFVVEDEHWSLPGKTVDHALVCVDVEKTSGGIAKLTVRAVDSAGKDLDRFTLSRPSTVGAGGGLASGQTHSSSFDRAVHRATGTGWPWVVGGSAGVAVAGAALARHAHSRADPAQTSDQPGPGGREHDTQQQTTHDVGEEVPAEIEPANELDQR